MQKVAIDIGYGDVKVCTETLIFKFPTAICKKQRAQMDYEAVRNDCYMLDGVEYIVGTDALPYAISTRNFNFLVKYSPILMRHALKFCNLNPSEPYKIGAGLSFVNWGDRDEILANLNAAGFEKVELRPQGMGVFFDSNALDGTVCIVDVGYHTLDFLVFKDGIIRPEFCFANRNGVNRIIVEFAKILTRKYKFDLSEMQANEIFRVGEFKHFGNVESVAEYAMAAKEDYADFLINEIMAKSGEIVRGADAVIFSGGGAYLLEDIDRLTNTPNIKFANSPYEFANVRGYLKVLKG